MGERTTRRLGIIVVLAALAIWFNWDIVQKGYEHPRALLDRLTWQSEDVERRSLKLREGLDLQGGLQILYQAEGDIKPELMEQTKKVIQNRVDSLGVTEPNVQVQGTDKLVVELPGVEDPDQALKTIGKTALLEFIFSGDAALTEGITVESSYPTLFRELPADKQAPFQGDPDAVAPTAAATTEAAGAGTPAATAAPSPTAAAGAKTTTIYPSVLSGGEIASASAQYDAARGGAVVAFEMKGEGSDRLGSFTGDHIGKFMPIILDGEVISSPTVNDRISTSGQISGRFTMADAEILAAQIESGALPLKLNLVSQNRIGATLGKQTIDSAIRGGLIGLLAVLLFMLLYYRVPGLLADAALVLYALFTMAIFRALPVTLTLAGIAGFVLSVGMAVDANVLIFERIKEELRGGRRVTQALETGFSRAWSSIRDSNASTLITCVILFWFGNRFGASIVKGFAITLALGVITSMFTAITVTRTFMQLANHFGWFKETPGVASSEDPRLKRIFGY
ncbi:MAG: protein translocase subunit SecD [Anaerolineae bacterium]